MKQGFSIWKEGNGERGFRKEGASWFLITAGDSSPVLVADGDDRGTADREEAEKKFEEREKVSGERFEDRERRVKPEAKKRKRKGRPVWNNPDDPTRKPNPSVTGSVGKSFFAPPLCLFVSLAWFVY